MRKQRVEISDSIHIDRWLLVFGSVSTGGKDSAEKAGASFFARSPAHRYPTTIAELLGTNRQSFSMDALSGTAAISSFLESPHAIKGEGWTLTMSGGGAGPPKFRCT